MAEIAFFAITVSEPGSLSGGQGQSWHWHEMDLPVKSLNKVRVHLQEFQSTNLSVPPAVDKLKPASGGGGALVCSYRQDGRL